MGSCTGFSTEFHLKSDSERSIKAFREVPVIYTKVIPVPQQEGRAYATFPAAAIQWGCLQLALKGRRGHGNGDAMGYLHRSAGVRSIKGTDVARSWDNQQPQPRPLDSWTKPGREQDGVCEQL